MPKLNWIAVAAASVAFFLVGFIWYGVLFEDAWMAAKGIPAEPEDAGNPSWMLVGFIITVMQVVGLAMALKWKGAAGPAAAATTAATLWALFALPFTLYGYIYSLDHNSTLLMIDASHLLVGWIVSAIVLSLFK
ncbi:MAG: DUF1761 domain-containing protein [Parvularculaceae bacterium]